jgi:hypothetical protein
VSNGVEASRAVKGVAQQWPAWVRALLFFVLALGAALAGVLDDWVRILFAVAFVGIGLTFLAGARPNRSGEPPAAPPTYPTAQHEIPEPDAG